MRAGTFLKDRIFRIGRAPPIWWVSDRKGAADPERATIVFGGNAMGSKKKSSVMGYTKWGYIFLIPFAVVFIVLGYHLHVGVGDLAVTDLGIASELVVDAVAQ